MVRRTRRSCVALRRCAVGRRCGRVAGRTVASSPRAAAPRPAAADPANDPVLDADRRVRPPLQGRPDGARRSATSRARKQEFDQAVDVLLESPYGGRTEPRIREHFDRLVDRISAYEVKALAEGDGFTEKQYEPASIDELLALSATLAPPLPSAGARGHGRRPTCRPPRTTSRFRSTSGCCRSSSCSRAGCTTSSRKA